MGLLGRRTWAVAALVLGIGLAVPVAALAADGSSGSASAQRHARPMLISDGLLTVGAPETLRVIHVHRKPHRRLKAYIYPPPTATICNQESFDLALFSLCLPQPLHPAPGTRPLKAIRRTGGPSPS